MLKLSARGDYGLMFLQYLAELPSGRSTTVKWVAQERHLPVKFLERQAAALAEAGIVTSRPGQGGGYALAKPAAKLPLVTVLEALEGGLEPVHCTHDGRCCDRVAACERKTGWQAMHSKLYELLSAYSLADILASMK